MELPGSIVRHLLLPVSWIYGAVTGVRNFMYDLGLLRSHRFPIPVVCVGNLTVGGTGKTPHVEYLLRLLAPRLSVAVVSRGYRRKTKGLVLAGAGSTAADIGDEPYQMHCRFPQVRLAVDGNRCEAISRLLEPDIEPPVDAVVLDDAFQHRAVTPGMSILLVEYGRPVFRDRFLPSGYLRDGFRQRHRAQIVIVTKCPPTLSLREKEDFARNMRLRRGTEIFFSKISYGIPYKVFGGGEKGLDQIAAECAGAVAVAGIARPEPFFSEIRSHIPALRTLSFADHHAFSANDIRTVENLAAHGQNGKPYAVITTEKDAARLRGMEKDLSAALRQNLYALPVEAEFLFGEQEKFNDIIIRYVGKDT